MPSGWGCRSTVAVGYDGRHTVAVWVGRPDSASTPGLMGRTAAAPIQFFAEPGVLINQRNATTPDGINLEIASHIVIDGFTVTGMPRAVAAATST